MAEDGERFRDVGEGRVGEVWLCSPSKAKGYFNNPEKTKEDFHAKITEGEYVGNNLTMYLFIDVFSDDPNDWLRTGDMGFLFNVRCEC